MALDRLSQVTSSGLASPINIGIATLTSTVVGSAVTINSSGIDVAGIVTATTANFVNATISGDLTVEGTTTTLDTILTEVDKLEVGANNTTVGVAITQSGSGDILNLYDGSSEVFSVADGGAVTTSGDISVGGDLTLPDAIVHSGDTDTKIRFPATDTFTVETAGSEALRVNSTQRVEIGGGGAAIDSRLHVTEPTASGRTNVLTLETRGTSEDDGPAINFISDSGSTVNGSIVGAKSQDSGSDAYLAFYTYSSSTLSERLRIGSAGQIGLGGTNYGTAGQVLTSNGSGSAVSWEDASGGGITTEAATPSNAVVQINLTDATDHKITATGICTITSTTAGTEGQSHTIRIVNSGIATVGFSTYFLFPSGSVPSLPTADGAVSIISFTVHDSVGAGCTQLLAGASVNFS